MTTNENAMNVSGGANPARARVTALSIVFLVSGVCGLIYESIWSHYLKLFVGHAAYAQTVVLVVFVGGMAIGAALIGRFATRIRSPLIGYAVAEGVIGVISLFFHKIFVASTDWAYASLLPAACAPESGCATQWIFASLLILPQSILLGTTFPLMTSGVLRIAPDRPGRRIALLYFLNSIGAAAGVMLAGFVLIDALGLPGTLLTAGLMNLGVALAAYLCAKGSSEGTIATEHSAASARAAIARGWLIAVAALTGLASFIYEIVWVRMLSMVVGASTHSFELMLAAFILGLALGGLWVRERIDRFRDIVVALAVVQVLMGIAAISTLALYDGLFDVMAWLLGALRRGDAGYALFNLSSHALALVIMLPATFLAGTTLPLITTALLRGRDGERAIGYVYAANTLGSIVGVIVAVHVALPLLGIKGGLLLGASIDIGLGILLFARAAPSPAFRALRWSAAGILALVVVAASVPVLPERLASGVYRGGHAKLGAAQEVVFHQDGKSATITVVRNPSHLTIATNGKPDAAIATRSIHATTDEMTMALAAMLPLAYRPDAQMAAVIGFGSGMTTATLLGSPAIRRVDTIEIEPQMVEGARLFGKSVEAAFVDPRSRIVFDDAKSYFARSSDRFDLIVSEPSNPWVSGVASLFTQEFYARVKRQLAPNGLFVQWVQTYEFNDRLLATILRALDGEFADYRVYAANEGDLVILASLAALPEQATDALTRWDAMRPLRDRLRLHSIDELEARRIAGSPALKPVLAAFGSGVNSDYYPIVDQAAPKARFAGESANGLMKVATAPVPILEMLLGEKAPTGAFDPQPVATSTRRALLSGARESVAYMKTGVAANGSSLAIPRDIGLLRAALWSCAPLPRNADPSLLMLDLASYVNPFVPPDDAAALWRAVRAAPCASKLPAADQRWLDLFYAVGARDAGTMAVLGKTLAAAPAAEPLASYAVMAAVTGLLVEGRAPEAEQFLGAALQALSPAVRDGAPMRLLGVLAHSALVRQAALQR